jgi:hypothetical protein
MILLPTKWRDLIFIPTAGKAGEGTYVELEPVEKVALADERALVRALEQTMVRGNPPVKWDPLGEQSKPLLPRLAGVRSARQFEAEAMPLMIRVDAGGFHVTHYRRAPRAGYLGDPARDESLPASIGVEGLARYLAQQPW